jgi:hypothetical protein
LVERDGQSDAPFSHANAKGAAMPILLAEKMLKKVEEL